MAQVDRFPCIQYLNWCWYHLDSATIQQHLLCYNLLRTLHQTVNYLHQFQQIHTPIQLKKLLSLLLSVIASINVCPILIDWNLYSIKLFGFVWAFESMITFHNFTVATSGKWDSVPFTLCNAPLVLSASTHSPIQFGRQHKYAIRTTQFFAQPPRCQLSFTQRFFFFSVIKSFTVEMLYLLTF